MNVFDQLVGEHDLPTAERSVAAFIVANPDEILTMSIQDLAASSFTSTTTVMRLCRRLGFKGFKDFRLRFFQDYRRCVQRDKQVDVNLPFKQGDSEFSIANKIGTLSKETIMSCQAFLDHGSIREAISRMTEARNIVAMGVSDSFIRLVDFQNKMLKIGWYIRLSYFQPEQVFLCTQVTPNDLGILVSYSGRTAEVVHDAAILKQRCVPMVAITSDNQAPLASMANTTILLPNDESGPDANYTLSSQIAIEYVLNILFACIYESKYEQSRKYLRTSREKYLNDLNNKTKV